MSNDSKDELNSSNTIVSKKNKSKRKGKSRSTLRKRCLLFEMTDNEKILLSFALQSISSLSFDTILVDNLTHGY
jgi:hypothetical protein